MTDKQTYWLVDDTGHYALVAGADERDRWIPRGWSETGEPTGEGKVWAWYEGIEKPAEFTIPAYREIWKPRGWQAGPPEEPVSPINGDQIAAEQARRDATASPVAVKAESKSTSKKAATGGEE